MKTAIQAISRIPFCRHGPSTTRYFLLLAALIICIPAWADSWAPAQISAVASPKGEVIVRILPGTNLGDVYGFAGEQNGKAATAVYYRLDKAANYVKYQEAALMNPIAPVFAAVSDDGELITLDNWHNMGIGKAVVIYQPDGKVLRTYDLTEIYTEAELEKLQRSVSSIWWRCNTNPVFERRISTLGFQDALGNSVDINVKTGKLTREASSRKGC